MSTETTSPAGTLMDPEAAFGIVHQRSYGPVFFDKLASVYGLAPRTEEEAMEMLRQASLLRQAHDAELEKQAQAHPDLLSVGREHLSSLFGGQTEPDDTEERAIKQAAAELANDPEMAQAVLSLEYAMCQAEQES